MVPRNKNSTSQYQNRRIWSTLRVLPGAYRPLPYPNFPGGGDDDDGDHGDDDGDHDDDDGDHDDDGGDNDDDVGL